MFPWSFHLLQKCRKWSERSKLIVKMLKIFSSFLSGFNVISKKKRKKGHHADGGIFFFDFMLISKKKSSSSKFCNFALWFQQHTRVRHRELRLSMVFGGRKTAGIRKISVQKCRKKIRTFLRLKGTPFNTVVYYLRSSWCQIFKFWILFWILINLQSIRRFDNESS